MKGFAPTAESHGFSSDLLWSGLRSGCRATKSRRSQSESAKLIGATGLPAQLKAGKPARRTAGEPCAEIDTSFTPFRDAHILQKNLIPLPYCS